MNKGLRAYVKTGLQTSKKIIKDRKVSRFKFLFLNIAAGIARLSLLPWPAFEHALIRMDKQNLEKNTYELTNVFSDTDNPKAYWTSLMTLVIRGILLISGAILIGALAFVLYYIGGMLGVVTGMQALTILLPLPAFIGLLVWLFGFTIVFTPCMYYLNNNPTLSITKVFNASVRTMKEQGKKTLFFIDFFYYAILTIYLLVAFLLSYAFLSSANDSLKIIGVLVAVIFVVIFIFIWPKLGMTNRIAKYSLMADIMLDPDEAEDTVLIKEKMIKQGLSKDEFLVNLFDNKRANEDGNIENDGVVLEQPKEDSEENKESEK